VERARVGQKTNYDRLVLEIWTDGTRRPEEAISDAARILLEHLYIVGSIDPEIFIPPAVAGDKEGDHLKEVDSALFEIPIEQLDLSVRVFNSLKRTGITNVGEVLEMLERGEEAMLSIRNFGEKSLNELIEKLSEKNYLPKDAERYRTDFTLKD